MLKSLTPRLLKSSRTLLSSYKFYDQEQGHTPKPEQGTESKIEDISFLTCTELSFFECFFSHLIRLNFFSELVFQLLF